jgi:hypothetical protein
MINDNQQDATILDFIYLYSSLHVLDDSFAHHQEHTTVPTASGVVNISSMIPASRNIG